MHAEPDAQVTAKAEIVAESMQRIGRFDASAIDELLAVGGAVDPAGYRTSIRVIGTGRGVAYREERTDRPTPITDCLVAHPDLSALLSDLEVAPDVELSLRISLATGAVTARWAHPGRNRGRRRRQQGPADADDHRATAHRAQTTRPVEGLPDGTHIGDRAHLTERIAGTPLRVSAPSFFQSGPAAAELLVQAVSSAAPELSDARHAVDAYGGVGLFAATSMAAAGTVTVVESARSSVLDARHNLGHRGDTAEVVLGEVARWDPSSGPSVDVLVADPARSGLARPGVEAIVRSDAPVVVLVSCDPVSLSRDARLLVEAGYRPERVNVLDLFPQTPHVETVTRFTR